MNWREVRIVYGHELRSALREKTIVINGILMPIFLYPVLLWAMFTALSFVQGVNDGFTSRVAIEGEVPAAHAALLDSLDAAVELAGDRGRVADPRDQLAAGKLDLVVTFAPSPEGDRLADNFQVALAWDRAESRSSTAHDRVQSVINDYRAAWLRREGQARGLNTADRVVFAVLTENVATQRDVGQLLLGQMLSIFLIVMVALGCFMPAIDTTAGERERSTWETLMTVGASRGSIVVAKYLYVATLGIAAGALNVMALMISIGAIIEPLLGGSGMELDFAISPVAIPVMLAAATGLALFFAAGMMVLASFARSFKDGQAMVAPIYWLVFLPIVLGNQTDSNLTLGTALIPIVNISAMLRDAIQGVFIWEWIGVTLLVTLATVALLLLLARQVLRFEEFLVGSFDGSFWRFAKGRMISRG